MVVEGMIDERVQASEVRVGWSVKDGGVWYYVARKGHTPAGGIALTLYEHTGLGHFSIFAPTHTFTLRRRS